jgi:hypothetical protein
MKILVLAVTMTLASFWLMAGEVSHHRIISWKALETIRVNEEETFVKAYFDGAQYIRESGGLPIYSETFSMLQGFRPLLKTPFLMLHLKAFRTLTASVR